LNGGFLLSPHFWLEVANMAQMCHSLPSDQILVEDYLMAFSSILCVRIGIGRYRQKDEIIELLFLKLGGLNVLSATHSPWDMSYVENGN
jgi:hypothetical protein